MSDNWFDKYRRRFAIRRQASAAQKRPMTASTAALQACHMQQQRLQTMTTERQATLLAMLSDDVFDELTALYHSELSLQQLTTLDRAVSRLGAVRALLPPAPAGGFSLTELFDEVRSLATTEAIAHGCELHTLVYDDLPDHFHGDPAKLRILLLQHCSAMLRGMESGALIIRAMIDDSDESNELDDDDDPDPQDTEGDHPLRVCISLQSGCEAMLAAPPELDADAIELATTIGAWLQPCNPGEQELALVLTLEVDASHASPPLPAPLDHRVVEIFHPCSSARYSLESRLRGMNLHTRELEQLSDSGLGGDQVATLLLAVPVGADLDGALAMLSARASTPTPLLVLSDQPPPATLPAEFDWLPACIDDQSLYQHLSRILRKQQPANPTQTTPSDLDPMLTEELTRMLAAEFPATLAHLQDCARRGDREELKTIAHKLKGGSAYCGASGLHEVARALDQVALTAATRHIDYLLERLSHETCGLPEPAEK